MRERWRPVNGYEKCYLVSDYGKIRSLDRLVRYRDIRFKKMMGKLLKPVLTNRGYLRVMLAKNGKRRWFAIHRLVAGAFVKNKYNKPQVNHKDGIKSNNFYKNLEWATQAENNQHSYDELGKIVHNRGKIGSESPHSKPVLQFNRIGRFIKRWAGQSDAARALNLDSSGISKVCLGKISNHGGFLWKFEI